ncbi:hypothetical protein J056_003532 [Wallemia ichthyophaga EXF-994]|uniref:Uncharacterized protein n=1 Tax=Wallemia ichthyophaga (strain EXF-994 / CBS 113033) TaxID=1299270 RepID=R9AEZ3_WALI9|nr:uncharacterized protein J056_003532 [Wallemia ichthyophaga EXF-994]EOQ98655.1 hypothetical protein J056_003532 [Wallemia ichthyophaga EXF-994]
MCLTSVPKYLMCFFQCRKSSLDFLLPTFPNSASDTSPHNQTAALPA